VIRRANGLAGALGWGTTWPRPPRPLPVAKKQGLATRPGAGPATRGLLLAIDPPPPLTAGSGPGCGGILLQRSGREQGLRVLAGDPTTRASSMWLIGLRVKWRMAASGFFSLVCYQLVALGLIGQEVGWFFYSQEKRSRCRNAGI